LSVVRLIALSVVLSLMMLALPGCGGSEDSSTQAVACSPRPFTDTTIDTADGQRTFMTNVPDQATRTVGIIFDFHGTGGTPAAEEAFSHLGERGRAVGFVVVQPQALGTPAHWTVPGITGPDDGALVASLTAKVRDALCLPDVPTFATGLSAGAGMSSALACAGTVRAAAPVAGAALVRRCPDGPRVSMLTFHGTADQAVPFNGAPGWEQKETQPRGFFVGAVTPIMESWAARNGCSPMPVSTPIGSETLRITWPDCQDGVQTVMYRIEGGGHNQPGTQAQIDALGLNAMIGPSTDDIDATTVILDFFGQSVTHG